VFRYEYPRGPVKCKDVRPVISWIQAPGFIETNLLNGVSVTSSTSNISNSLAFGVSFVKKVNAHNYFVEGSGHAEPMKGDLPLLAFGDSGGASYHPNDSLLIVGVNSEANILGAGSYVARVDINSPYKIYQFIKSIISY